MDRHKYMLISCAVLPRAHDCITLLMGSRTRYLEYFKAHPGTYFRSVFTGSLVQWEAFTRKMGPSRTFPRIYQQTPTRDKEAMRPLSEKQTE
ncbi:MAG: DUF1638 domain-containing protein [Rhodothermia bacterium]